MDLEEGTDGCVYIYSQNRFRKTDTLLHYFATMCCRKRTGRLPIVNRHKCFS
jgi:hypothetical protein